MGENGVKEREEKTQKKPKSQSGRCEHTSKICLSTFFFQDCGTREKAKTRFEKWIQHGKRWVKLIARLAQAFCS